MRRELLDQRDENRIEENVAIFRVVDDVLDLLRKETGIDCVQDTAAAGHAVVQFQMAKAIPGERGNRMAEFDPQRRQRIGQAFGPLGDDGIIRAVNGAVRMA